MSVSSVKSTVIAFSAAFTLSVVTVGATVSPVQASMIHVSGVARG